MNFNTVKQALYEKIKMMSEEDFNNFLIDLKRAYYKTHSQHKIKEVSDNDLYYRVVKEYNS